MGYYKKEAGLHNDKPFFRQVDSKGRGNYLYYHVNKKIKGNYQVSPKLEKGLSKPLLKCVDKSGFLLPNNWQFYHKDKLLGDTWADDDDVIVVSKGKMTSCGNISIKLSKDVERQSAADGEYYPTGEFSAGRHVYKHKNRDHILQVLPHKSYWYVTTEQSNLGQMLGENEHLRSAAAGSLNPADVRNNSSARKNWKTWSYKVFKGWNQAGKGKIVVKEKQ